MLNVWQLGTLLHMCKKTPTNLEQLDLDGVVLLDGRARRLRPGQLHAAARHGWGANEAATIIPGNAVVAGAPRKRA